MYLTSLLPIRLFPRLFQLEVLLDLARILACQRSGRGVRHTCPAFRRIACTPSATPGRYRTHLIRLVGLLVVLRLRRPFLRQLFPQFRKFRLLLFLRQRLDLTLSSAFPLVKSWYKRTSSVDSSNS